MFGGRGGRRRAGEGGLGAGLRTLAGEFSGWGRRGEKWRRGPAGLELLPRGRWAARERLGEEPRARSRGSREAEGRRSSLGHTREARAATGAGPEQRCGW